MKKKTHRVKLDSDDWEEIDYLVEQALAKYMAAIQTSPIIHKILIGRDPQEFIPELKSNFRKFTIKYYADKREKNEL